MKTILIQNENYALGLDIAISIGRNTKGNQVISKSIICLNGEGKFFCTNGGIKISLKEEDLKDFYLNTPENVKLLKSKIAQK